MILDLKRPLTFIDLETTGTDKAKDRITEIAIVKVFTNGVRRTFSSLVNPGRLLSDELVELTGITNEELAKAPVFGQIAKEVHDLISDSDIAGYGVEDFDVPILWEELSREGETWNMDGVAIVDAMGIFKKKESRSLSAAMRFYLNTEMQGAHRAKADTEAAREVLDAQLERYPDLPRTVPELAAESNYHGSRVDLAGRMVKNAEGVVVFTFGKFKDKPFHENVDYAKWMLREEFPRNTKMWIRSLMGNPFEIKAPTAPEVQATMDLRPNSMPTEREDLTLPI